MRFKICGALVLAALLFGLLPVSSPAAQEWNRESRGWGNRKLDLMPNEFPLLASANYQLAQASEESTPSAATDLLKDLNERNKKIKIHKTLGIVSAALLVGALATAGGAKDGSSSKMNTHANYAYAAGAFYAASGLFAINAPKSPGGPATLGGKIHKGLAWIHFPAMALAIISGRQAQEQKEDKESLHGLADKHVGLATLAAITFYSAVVVVYF